MVDVDTFVRFPGLDTDALRARAVTPVDPQEVLAHGMAGPHAECRTSLLDTLAVAGIEVIAVDGNELGRGRGGSRCMTCPIERDGL